MKNIIKKWWFWLIFLLIFILVILMYIFINKSKNEGVGTAGISKEEYENIKTGMSQFEVEGIIDKFGEWNDDIIYEKCCEEISSSNKNHIYTYQYKYYGEKNGYAIITYEADYSDGVYLKMPEVVKKENNNLK